MWSKNLDSRFSSHQINNCIAITSAFAVWFIDKPQHPICNSSCLFMLISPSINTNNQAEGFFAFLEHDVQCRTMSADSADEGVDMSTSRDTWRGAYRPCYTVIYTTGSWYCIYDCTLGLLRSRGYSLCPVCLYRSHYRQNAVSASNPGRRGRVFALSLVSKEKRPQRNEKSSSSPGLS